MSTFSTLQHNEISVRSRVRREREKSNDILEMFQFAMAIYCSALLHTNTNANAIATLYDPINLIILLLLISIQRTWTRARNE